LTCSRRLHGSVPLTECVAKPASRARAPWLARSGSGPGMACWVVERPRRTAPIRCALLPDPSRGRVPSRLQPRSPPTLGQLVHGGGGGHRGSGDAWARTYSLSLKRVEGCGCRLSHMDQVIRWETESGSRTDVANPHWRAKGALFTRARDVQTGLPGESVDGAVHAPARLKP